MVDDKQAQLARLLSVNRLPKKTQPGIFNVPEPRATMESASRFGPTFKVFNPAKEMAEKATEPTYGTMEGLNMAMSIFDEADSKIPAQETPQQAVVTGVKRGFGSTELGRLVGMNEEDARSYNKIRDTFGTLLARAFGERGVVTNQDVARVMSAFPKNNDTIEGRRQQREFVENFLKQRIERYNKLVSLMGGRRLANGQ
jgi:hypothetical protein